MKQTIRVYNLGRQEINITTIKYVEGYSNYSILHLANQKPIMLSRSVVTFENELLGFVRIHKKHLVNPQFVVTYRFLAGKQLTIILTGGEVLAVSRRRIASVLAALTSIQSFL